MRGDRLLIEDHHRRAAQDLCTIVLRRLPSHESPRFCVGIAGESGSGKSETAAALTEELQQAGAPAIVIQQDDYFFLPPRTNAQRRRRDLEWVGPQEVDLARLDADAAVAQSGAASLEKPLVDYPANEVLKESLDLTGFLVIVIEGTYVMLLNHLDLRAFIDRTIHETKEARLRRCREPQDDILHQVLEREHKIISTHRSFADILVTKAYEVILRDDADQENTKLKESLGAPATPVDLEIASDADTPSRRGW